MSPMMVLNIRDIIDIIFINFWRQSGHVKERWVDENFLFSVIIPYLVLSLIPYSVLFSKDISY